MLMLVGAAMGCREQCLANSVCETHVEQKITKLELHEKLGYKAYEVWEIKKYCQEPRP